MWTRRSLLLGGAGLLALPRLAAAATDKRLIVVLASGGWDVTYALDPKLGVPTVDGPELDEDLADPEDREAIGTFAGIPVAVNGARRGAVTRFFEAHGRSATVINGIHMAAIAHEAALARILTGTGDETRADLGAIAGQGSDGPLGYVDLSGQAFFGPYASRCGRLGLGGQLGLLLEPGRISAPEGSGVTYPTWSPTTEDLAALDAFVSGRAVGSPLVGGLLESRARAGRLREVLPGALDGALVGESASLISDGRTAIELLQGGVCRSVLLDSRAHWDTHADNVQQHAAWQSLFLGLKVLVDALVDRAMLADTLVVVLSEMTRTPVRNVWYGKDHWPYTSALLVGGGIGGGRVLGGTNDRLESEPVDLETGALDPAGEVIRYDNVVAGILELLDVDPAEHLPRVIPLRGA